MTVSLFGEVSRSPPPSLPFMAGRSCLTPSPAKGVGVFSIRYSMPQCISTSTRAARKAVSHHQQDGFDADQASSLRLECFMPMAAMEITRHQRDSSLTPLWTMAGAACAVDAGQHQEADREQGQEWRTLVQAPSALHPGDRGGGDDHPAAAWRPASA